MWKICIKISWFGGKLIWEENQIAAETITYLNFSNIWKSWYVPQNVKSLLYFQCEKYCIHEWIKRKAEYQNNFWYKRNGNTRIRAWCPSRSTTSLPPAGIPSISIKFIAWCLMELSMGTILEEDDLIIATELQLF